ncbi:transglycosylase SLT domain-containing protein [Aestuariibius insulae]|uniref:transglycosylase SLT domain-containing protein n=1 Tax=Aestuariibius insulae TaxID=2058287 RepID=UPI00345EF279
MRRLMMLAVAVLLAGCAVEEPPEAPPGLPLMAWDHRSDSDELTLAALTALRGHGAALVQTVPADVTRWCPAYPEADASDRAAFWSGLFSTLAEHESTWNPRAVGGGGRWFGLVQIDPATARGYGCAAKTGEALKDGPANLSCAVRIATHQVQRRGTIARGMLDWGPFHSSGKRAEMRAFTRAQSYCQP